MKKNGIYSKLINSPYISTFLISREGSFSGLKQTINGHVVELEQTHSGDVCVLPRITQSYSINDTPFRNVDAAITNQKNVYIAIRTADCLPILIFHDSGVVAAIHAGRKGTESLILKTTLNEMKTSYACSSGHFYVWFGPKICHSCYQINKEKDLYYNLYEKNMEQLKLSVTENEYSLISSPFCTKCQNHLWFSYRLEGTSAGRIYSVIGLNNSII